MFSQFLAASIIGLLTNTAGDCPKIPMDVCTFPTQVAFSDGCHLQGISDHQIFLQSGHCGFYAQGIIMPYLLGNYTGTCKKLQASLQSEARVNKLKLQFPPLLPPTFRLFLNRKSALDLHSILTSPFSSMPRFLIVEELYPVGGSSLPSVRMWSAKQVCLHFVHCSLLRLEPQLTCFQANKLKVNLHLDSSESILVKIDWSGFPVKF